MSQEKTSVPGMENSYYANKKNNMYSRTTTPDMGSRGTMVPGMEEVAPNVGRHESSAKGGAPVVGFLYSISRQGIGEYWPLHIGSNKIGRSGNCDICLKEGTVSDIHAELNIKQMKTTHKILASIKDIGSKNGIFVNEEELDYSAHECFKNGTINEEQARLSEQSNMITKALGANSDIEADIVELPYEKGDRFMLCTDGIWGMFPERKLIDIVAGTSSLGGAVESIVIRVDEEGIANGGKHDNLTVALIETNSNSILKEKMSTKIRNILFALIFICCVSIAGNIIQGFYLPGQAVASSKSEELDIEALQKVWSEKLQAEFDEKLRKSEQEQKRTIDSLSQIITNNPGKAKEYMEVIINQYDIIERLDDIINNLQELRDVSEGKEKEQKLKETVAMVQKLEPELKKKYGISENEFNGKEKNGREYGILLLLKQNIAKENSSRAQSHYDSIINRVKEIRDKIK